MDKRQSRATYMYYLSIQLETEKYHELPSSYITSKPRLQLDTSNTTSEQYHYAKLFSKPQMTCGFIT